MKKIVLLFALFLTFAGLRAQMATVHLTAQSLHTNRVVLNDLLQFYIQPQTDVAFKAYVRVVVEQAGNTSVSILRSALFELDETVIIATSIAGYNGANLQLLSSRSGFENIQQSNFVFPSGAYNYCIELISEEGELIHKDCAAFKLINPLTLFLIYPFDQQELEEDRPVFTWTPINSGAYSNINYRIRWVENNEKANASEVFYTTQDFYQLSNLGENILPYKEEYPEFDPEKYYYWQVEAFSGRTILAKSDIWEFHFPEEIEKEQALAYVKVDLERFTDLHLFNGDFLSFEWTNDYSMIPFEYKILDFENKVISNTDRENLGAAQTGKNYFQMDVSDLVEVNKVYTLEVSGSKKTYRIKFKKIKL